MRRDHIAIITGAAMLATSVIVWHDLFLFSKVVRLPGWAASLPSPINTPRYLAFLCLLPGAFFTSTLSAAIRAVAWTVLFAPLPALVVYLASAAATGAVLWFNAAFNYAWVVGWHCLAPALAVLTTRAVARGIKRRVAG